VMDEKGLAFKGKRKLGHSSNSMLFELPRERESPFS
jgi:hypothetical protein